MILSFVAISNFLMAEIEYDIQDIGTLQTHSSQAIAINNQGQILGWYNIDGSQNGKHFFVRNKNGEFHEIPSKTLDAGLAIDWQFLVDNGKVYGTFAVNQATTALCVWDHVNGFVKMGVLPGKDVVAINNAGQVLIKSIVENENGKSVRRPVIWENGKITKLHGLEGDIGIESEESYGFAMNNKGEVVGQSFVYLSYKNNIFKQIHAVKWVNGYPMDLHNKIPKSIKTYGIAINDLGEILIYVGETKEYLPKYLIRNDGGITVFSYDLNKLNNLGCVYNNDYDYGVPVKGSGFIIKDRNGKDLCHDSSIKSKIQKDSNSIWMTINKIIKVNDNGEIIAQGETIYGEQHSMLLVPIVNDREPEKNEPSSEETVEIPNQEITKADLEIVINNIIDAAFIYHTEGIEEKVRVRFLEVYDHAHPSEARMVQAPYRKLLMIDALEGVIDEIENLSVALHCEKNISFWEIAHIRLKEKSPDWKQSVDAYIKIKTGYLK